MRNKNHTNNEIERAKNIARGISSHSGERKLEMTPQQIENWYQFLLTEQPAINYSKINIKLRCQIFDMYLNGDTVVEISRKVKFSKTPIINIIINKKYNKLLARVHATAVRLGDEEEKTWVFGGKLCL